MCIFCVYHVVFHFIAYNKTSHKLPIFQREVNNQGPETRRDCSLTGAKVSVYGSCLKAKICNYKAIDSSKKYLKLINKTSGNYIFPFVTRIEQIC